MTMARSNDVQRIYAKGEHYYADLRDFADVGGKQEALIPPGKPMLGGAAPA